MMNDQRLRERVDSNKYFDKQGVILWAHIKKDINDQFIMTCYFKTACMEGR